MCVGVRFLQVNRFWEHQRTVPNTQKLETVALPVALPTRPSHRPRVSAPGACGNRTTGPFGRQSGFVSVCSGTSYVIGHLMKLPITSVAKPGLPTQTLNTPSPASLRATRTASACRSWGVEGLFTTIDEFRVLRESVTTSIITARARYLSRRTAAAPCRTRHRGPIGGRPRLNRATRLTQRDAQHQT
jgi:hypothetical protein